LSTRLKDKEEKILKTLEALTSESENGTPIIVEGKKDIETLRILGVTGAILAVKTGGKSFVDIVVEVEKMGTRDAILFLDFDRRGKEGTRNLKLSLERAGVKPNIRFWKELLGLLGRDIQCVESLTTYLRTLRAKIGEAKHQKSR
jgi:5S rRNA maturation endonuclease (ribonuclease M5)